MKDYFPDAKRISFRVSLKNLAFAIRADFGVVSPFVPGCLFKPRKFSRDNLHMRNNSSRFSLNTTDSSPATVPLCTFVRRDHVQDTRAFIQLSGFHRAQSQGRRWKQFETVTVGGSTSPNQMIFGESQEVPSPIGLSESIPARRKISLITRRYAGLKLGTTTLYSAVVTKFHSKSISAFARIQNWLSDFWETWFPCERRCFANGWQSDSW